MGWLHSGVPRNVRARAAEYRVDAACGVMFRTYGLVASGVVALLTILTIPSYWTNVGSMASAIGLLAVLAGSILWLSRSLSAHRHKLRLMQEAARGGAWVQARVLDVQTSYVGHVGRRWSFQRTRLRLWFTDPNTGHPRDFGSDLYLHPEEHIVSGQVIWVRCHPTLPEPVFVPVCG